MKLSVLKMCYILIKSHFNIFTVHHDELQMKRFDQHDYYQICRDSKIVDFPYNLGIKLRPSGVNLIINYYDSKYHSKINSSTDGSIFESVFDVANNHLTKIRSKSKTHENYREAFILDPLEFHSVLFIYIKEKGKEAILFANSTGVSANDLEGLKEFAKTCAKENIIAFCVTNRRQADIYSCHTDAIILGKDATAIDPITQQYKISNLLEKLENPKRAIQIGENLYDVKLPDELLRTAQIFSFLEEHQEKSERIVHKNQTLTMFRDQYTDKNINIRTETNQIIPKNVASFARKKGLKYSDIIEIQFYLEEIEKEYNLSDHQRNEFIKLAKQEFQKQLSMSQGIENRPGIYEFAEEFLMGLKLDEKQRFKMENEKEQNPKPFNKKESPQRTHKRSSPETLFDESDKKHAKSSEKGSEYVKPSSRPIHK